MNLYEHTIVAKQDVSASQIKQLTEKYAKIVTNNEGEILQTQNSIYPLRELVVQICQI